MQRFQPKVLRALALLTLTIGLLSSPVAGAAVDEPRIWGAWQTEKGDLTVKAEPGRLWVLREDRLSILPIRDLQADEIIVALEGAQVALPFSRSGGDLLLALEPTAEPQRFRRVVDPPANLELRPAEIGEHHPLASPRIEEIQQEIARRFERDQAVLAAGDQEAAEEVLYANRSYLRDLLQGVGWIERERFGAETSYQALVLAKHGEDLPLLLAVLPLAERDFRGDVQNPGAFPIVLDSVKLLLGEEQIYGTQIETDLAGEPILAPLEEPETVDQRRARQGLQPLEEYLALASQVLFDEKAIERDGCSGS